MSAFAPNAPTISVAVPCLPRASVVKPFSIATSSPPSSLLPHDIHNFNVNKCTYICGSAPASSLLHPTKTALDVAKSGSIAARFLHPQPVSAHVAEQMSSTCGPFLIPHSSSFIFSAPTITMWGNVGVSQSPPPGHLYR